MPTPSPRLLPLHRNGPLTVTCPVSQRRGTGSAACTCPATFTICILLWLEQPQQKEGSRPQKSAFGKPTEQAQEAKAAVLCPGAPAHSLPRAPPAQLILSPRRQPQPQPRAQPRELLRTLPRQVPGGPPAFAPQHAGPPGCLHFQSLGVRAATHLHPGHLPGLTWSQSQPSVLDSWPSDSYSSQLPGRSPWHLPCPTQKLS